MGVYSFGIYYNFHRMAHLFDDVSCSGTVGKDHQAEYEGLLRSGWSVFTCLRCFQTHIDSQN